MTPPSTYFLWLGLSIFLANKNQIGVHLLFRQVGGLKQKHGHETKWNKQKAKRTDFEHTNDGVNTHKRKCDLVLPHCSSFMRDSGRSIFSIWIPFSTLSSKAMMMVWTHVYQSAKEKKKNKTKTGDSNAF